MGNSGGYQSEFIDYITIDTYREEWNLHGLPEKRIYNFVRDSHGVALKNILWSLAKQGRIDDSLKTFLRAAATGHEYPSSRRTGMLPGCRYPEPGGTECSPLILFA